MTKEELVFQLEKLPTALRDVELRHKIADTLLLDFINDDAVQDAYLNIDKWYS